MSKVNVLKTIGGCRERINPLYDACLRDIRVLLDNFPGRVSLVSNSFVFGYAQGYKAAKAEMKKKQKKGGAI